MPITISKSKYMAGVQCLKRLYLQMHEPEIAGGKDAYDFALIEQGHDKLASLPSNFFRVVSRCSSGGPSQAIRITRELVANPEVPAILRSV